MQLQFAKRGISYLRSIQRQIQNQEQTQEFRISDGMPDIGSIIGAWGQVILRSKEWQSDGMTISGGTMVWIHYMPEDGGEPQCVESWLPFQMRWSFPETQHDGTIFTKCMLCSVDARSLSARKMMLRTNVSVLGWAMEPGNMEVYEPEELPEDVQLLKKTYPVELAAEAGEKSFSLDEVLSLPPSTPKIEKLFRFSLQPEITEKKLMSDKVVFRGNALTHICYLADDGGLYSWDFDLPFTQYSELEGEYDEDADVILWPEVTALELDREENDLHLKAGLLCQYRISHRPLVQVVEDVYSPHRSVVPIRQELDLPGILERKDHAIRIQQNAPIDGMRLMDVQFLPQPVQSHRDDLQTVVDLHGQFRVLCYDMEGNPQIETSKWEHSLTIPVGDVSVETTLMPKGKADGTMMSGNMQLTAEVNLVTETINTKPISVVSALELGEMEIQDPKRPSLILRRAMGKTLWELAKENGSTVQLIQNANQLQTEPEETKMLLIPVI